MGSFTVLAEDAAPAAGVTSPAVETPAGAASSAPESVVINAGDVKIGTPVFDSQGEKIGEVNRISSSSSGAIEGIQVTLGEPASLSAKSVSVSADKIVGLKGGVKLSLSADEAKSLPVL